MNTSMFQGKSLSTCALNTLAAQLIIACIVFPPALGASDAQREALEILLDGYDLSSQIPSLNTQSNSDGYYLIKAGETLDQIILNTMPQTSLRKSIVKQAFVAANPHAFKRSNPNWMYANKRIRLPDVDDIRRVVFKNNHKKNEGKAIEQDKKGWVSYP